MTQANRPRRYREIEVRGSARQMGQQIGEAAGDEIRGFCAVALQRVQKTTPITRDKAMRIARESAHFAEQYNPALVEELRGMAEAANVTLDDLMLLQVRNQLMPEPDAGCTSLAVSNGHSVVAQNWDNDPVLDAFTVVLTRRPARGPALMTCTQAGLVSYLGFNDAGIGACVNTLPAPSRDAGVPHYFILREIYAAVSLDEAIRAVERAQRAIPVNVMLSTPQGPADLEITIDKVAVLRPAGTTWLTHTNHCVHPQLKQLNADFPELIQSGPRKQRIDDLMTRAADEIDLGTIELILSDHSNHPTSICRHENSDPLHGFWETVFSIIIEPGERRMHVSRGTPCSHPYETYTM